MPKSKIVSQHIKGGMKMAPIKVTTSKAVWNKDMAPKTYKSAPPSTRQGEKMQKAMNSALKNTKNIGRIKGY